MFADILKSKPHNSHYLNRYIKFINQCIVTTHLLETEDHHICPKSSDLFPEFKSFKKYPWNKAALTLRQHYVAHRLLWKAYGGKQSQAFKLMCDRLKRNNSKCYEIVRKEHIAYMISNNHNADGLQAKRSWVSASDERRSRQAEIMREINKTKKKPKELRYYKCTNCNAELIYEEFCHHSPKEHYYCNATCRNRYQAKIRPSQVGKKHNRVAPAWNKGKSDTGFGDSRLNPMKNPESVKKMLETRKQNKLSKEQGPKTL